MGKLNECFRHLRSAFTSNDSSGVQQDTFPSSNFISNIEFRLNMNDVIEARSFKQIFGAEATSLEAHREDVYSETHTAIGTLLRYHSNNSLSQRTQRTAAAAPTPIDRESFFGVRRFPTIAAEALLTIQTPRLGAYNVAMQAMVAVDCVYYSISLRVPHLPFCA